MDTVEGTAALEREDALFVFALQQYAIAQSCRQHRGIVQTGFCGNVIDAGRKIIAAACRHFVCIADDSKRVERLGDFPLPLEVIPMARSYVAREIVQMGADPEYREGVITDNGNIILDCHEFKIDDPKALETRLNAIAGLVTCGLFAARGADELIIGRPSGDAETLVPS